MPTIDPMTRPAMAPPLNVWVLFLSWLLPLPVFPLLLAGCVCITVTVVTAPDVVCRRKTTSVMRVFVGSST
jgi:hypothetical protein